MSSNLTGDQVIRCFDKISPLTVNAGEKFKITIG